MMATSYTQLPGSKPRIIGANAHKYVNKDVTIIGEAVSLNMKANTVTLRTPDDETIIVLLENNTTAIELNLLTQVFGRLRSVGSIEAKGVIQFSQEQTLKFNKEIYVEMAHIIDAYGKHLEE